MKACFAYFCDLFNRKKDLFAKLGFSVTLKKICVRDPSKKRDFELPADVQVVTDPKEILDDDSIQVGQNTYSQRISSTA